MEINTAMKDHLERDKSFSFTATSAFKDDDSSIALFSDDNDDDLKNDTMSDTDDNSYIEIALDQPKFDHTTDHRDHRNALDKDLDNLRISFSSSFPSNIPEIRPNIVADFIEPAVVQASASSSLRFSASTFRSSSTGNYRGPVLGSESFSLYEGSRRRDHLPAFNPLIHTLLFSLESATETVDEKGGGDDHNNCEDDPMQLAKINADHKYSESRVNSPKRYNTPGMKSSNITIATTSGGHHNNGIMKLLMIKFRATKVRKLLTSLFANTSNKGNDRYFMRKRLRSPYNYSKGTLEYYDHDHYYFGNDSISVNNDNKSSYDIHDYHHNHRVGNKSRALDVNLGAVRGVLEAMNMTRSGRSKRKTSSCPSSVKSSPIHQGFAGDVGPLFARENSIQAAIAHCKSSLGQSSDFRF